MVTIPQTCLKVVEKFNYDMTFVWYEGSILWHEIQFIISLPYSQSSEKNAFERFTDIKNNDFKEVGVINLNLNSEINISIEKRFNNKLCQSE